MLKEIYDIYIKEKQNLISKLSEKQSILYNNMLVVLKQIDLKRQQLYIDTEYNMDKILELSIDSDNKYKELFSKSIGQRKNEKLNNINNNIEKCKNKEIPEELYMAIILKKMFLLGYNYDRHEHRIERIGKKYQWIAFFELLGECMTNLHIKNNVWHDYYDFVNIDIDALQYKNQSQEIYDFYDLYNKAIKELQINWDVETFDKVYDNISSFLKDNIIISIYFIRI